MGFDSFGLPAEQYAVKTGQHPKKTTEKNIVRFKEQLDNLGLSFDWDREIKTSDSRYYKWTQWMFANLFDSYYCQRQDKAMPISHLVNYFSDQLGLSGVPIRLIFKKEKNPYDMGSNSK